MKQKYVKVILVMKEYKVKGLFKKFNFVFTYSYKNKESCVNLYHIHEMKILKDHNKNY